jgi:hypothetical protein
MPAMIDGATYTVAGVRKPPRNEPAGDGGRRRRANVIAASRVAGNTTVGQHSFQNAADWCSFVIELPQRERAEVPWS